MNSTAQDIKQAAHKLIEELPENSTWDDVLYSMAVRRSIELGLEQSDNGLDTKSVRKEFGLDN